MYCGKCGAELKNEAKFCSKCGAVTKNMVAIKLSDEKTEETTGKQNVSEDNSVQRENGMDVVVVEGTAGKRSSDVSLKKGRDWAELFRNKL